MTTKKFPCEDCILLAICRHKRYDQTFFDCSLIFKLIPMFQCFNVRDKDKIFLLQDILKPTAWAYKYIEYSTYPRVYDKLPTGDTTFILGGSNFVHYYEP
jgi:hypothetical protein